MCAYSIECRTNALSSLPYHAHLPYHAAMDQFKTCTKCKVEYPSSNFYKRNAKCKLCFLAVCSKYRQKNRDRIKTRSADYRAANIDKIKAREKARYKANGPKIRSMVAQYRRDNPDKVRQRAAAWRKANPEKVEAARAAWRARNIEKERDRTISRRGTRKVSSAAWRKTNPERVKASFAAWRKANIEKVRRTKKKEQAQHSSSLSDQYIKQQIYNRTGLRFAKICSELIEAKRLHLKVLRLIKEKR